MNLRFVVRNGKRILQTAHVEPIMEWKDMGDSGLQAKVQTGVKESWIDVPLCDEETGEEIEISD
jgi:hypothetical protein